MLSRPEHLHAFLSEIGIETRESETGTVDGGLANFAVKPHTRSLQLHLQLFSVRIVKALHGDNRDTLLLDAWRCNRLGRALFRHED
jgi:hypothetical protein